MSEYIKGKVEAISLKELPKIDQYDNTHRMGVKIGEDWFSFGNNKGGTYVNKDIKELNKGDVIDFKYEVNGDFNNVKKVTVEMQEKNPTPEPAPTKAQSGGSNKVDWDAKEKDIQKGQCFNLAVEVGILRTQADVSDPNKCREAVIFYKTGKKGISDVFESAMNEPQPKVDDSKGDTKAYLEQPEHEFDDDVPF